MSSKEMPSPITKRVTGISRRQFLAHFSVGAAEIAVGLAPSSLSDSVRLGYVLGGASTIATSGRRAAVFYGLYVGFATFSSAVYIQLGFKRPPNPQ